MTAHIYNWTEGYVAIRHGAFEAVAPTVNVAVPLTPTWMFAGCCVIVTDALL